MKLITVKMFHKDYSKVYDAAVNLEYLIGTIPMTHVKSRKDGTKELAEEAHLRLIFWGGVTMDVEHGEMSKIREQCIAAPESSHVVQR